MTVVGGSTDHLIVDRAGNAQGNMVLDVQTIAGVPVTDVTAPSGWTGQAFPAGQARADANGYFTFVVPDGTGPVQVRTAARTVGSQTFAAGQWLTPSGQIVPDSGVDQALAGKLDTTVASNTLARQDTVPALYAETFAPLMLGRSAGTRFGFLGDSLTIGAGAPNLHGGSWPVYLGLVSGGVVRPATIIGLAGKRSDEILPSVQSIIDAGVNICPIQMGTNDVLQGVPTATSRDNIAAACTQLAAAGVLPVLVTLPPNNGGFKGAIAALNAWIKQYAAANGFPVLDFFGVLVDPANGNYAATYYNDGTHPNQPGYMAMAQYAWTALSPLLATVAPLLSEVQGDPANLLPNNLFLTDAGGDGTPDSWTRYGGGTGFANSIETGDANIKGNWAVITNTAATAQQILEFNKTTGFAVGDRILVSGRVNIAGASGGGTVGVKVTMTGNGTVYYPLYQISQPVTRGVYYQEMTVPAGTTAILLDFITTAGTVTAKYAQPTLYNLTALDADV